MKLFLSALLMGFFACLGSVVYAQNNDQIIIFIQDGRSISQNFKRDALPEIEEFAEQENLDLRIVDAREGAPREVTFTPAIFYQNDKGRFLFNGRYSNLNKLKKFVANSRQQNPSIQQPDHENLLVWQIGRATIAAPVVIHPMDSKKPKKFDEEAFREDALRSLTADLDYFTYRTSEGLPENTRFFTMHFYPRYDAREKVLLIDMEVYSNFNPEKPVFKTRIPSGAEWKEWENAFYKAGNRLEKAVVAQLSSGTNGDGFEPVKKNVEAKAWSQLNTMDPASYTNVWK